MTDRPKIVTGQKVYRVYLGFSGVPVLQEAEVVYVGKFLTLDQRLAAWDYRVKVEPDSCGLTPAEALEAFREDRRRRIELLRNEIAYLQQSISSAQALEAELKVKP